MTGRSQRENGGVVAFRGDPRHGPRPSTYSQRTNHARPQQEPKERRRHDQPQDLFSHRVDVVVRQEHVNQRCHDGDHGKYRVHDLPELVRESQRTTPHRAPDQDDQCAPAAMPPNQTCGGVLLGVNGLAWLQSADIAT